MKKIIVFILVSLLPFQLYAQRHASHVPHIVIEGVKALTISPSDLPGVRKIQAEQNARINGMSGYRFNPAIPFYLRSKDLLKLETPHVVWRRHIHNNFDSIKNKRFDIMKIDRIGNFYFNKQ